MSIGKDSFTILLNEGGRSTGNLPENIFTAFLVRAIRHKYSDVWESVPDFVDVNTYFDELPRVPYTINNNWGLGEITCVFYQLSVDRG